MNKNKTPVTLIIITTFFTHGLLLFNDGFYWDDWHVFSAVRKGWDYLYYNYYKEWGLGPIVYFDWTLYTISDSLFIYKLVIFLSLMGSSVLVFELAKKSPLLTSLEALWIALIFVSFTPVKSIPSSVSLIHYVFCVFLFFLASLFAVHSNPKIMSLLPASKRYPRIILRLCALILFSCSFVTYSLLVFYFGFLTYWFHLESAYHKNDFLNFRSVFSFLKPKWDFFLIPFAYWIIKIKYYAPDTEHADYNKFHLSPVSVLQNLLKHFYYAFFQEWDNSLIYVLRNPLVYLCLLMIFHFFIRRFTSGDDSRGDPPHESSKKVLLFGSLLFLMGSLPYALIGKSPVAEEFATRHALLSSLPIAILTVVAARFLPKKISQVSWIVLLIPLTGFCIMSNENYFIWQARSIKTHSVARYLEKHPTFGVFSNYVVVDEFKIGEKYDETTQWMELFNKEWGEKTRTVRFLEGFSTDASNGEVVIRIYRARYDNERYEVLKYLYFKLIQDPRLNPFLDNFTRVEINRLNS